MKKITEKEIIKRAEDYISYMKDLINNEVDFEKYNKKAVSDFKELQAYLSIYKYGKEEYKLMAFNWIKAVFGG